MSIENKQELNVGLNGVVDFKPIKMKQFDKNTRRIEITLLDGSDIYEIPNGAVAKFQATKPDGTIIFDDCNIENEMVVYKGTEQLSTYPGTVKCEIGIYEPDANGDTSKDGLLQSATFNIVVEESAMDRNAIISSNEFNTLTIMINTITGLVENATVVLAEIEAAISNTETAISNTEIAISAANQATTEARQATSTINTTNQMVNDNENIRITSENTRNTHETTRQSQEGARQTSTSTAITNADAATARANLASKAAEDVVSGIIDLPDIGTPGTYSKVTTDAKGRILSGSTPTAIADLGITNVYTKAEVDTNAGIKLDKTGDAKDTILTFTEPLTEDDLLSGSKISVLIRKISEKISLLKSGKVDKTSVVNNAITTVDGTVLDGKMGKILGDQIAANTNSISDVNNNLTSMADDLGLIYLFNPIAVSVPANTLTRITETKTLPKGKYIAFGKSSFLSNMMLTNSLLQAFYMQVDTKIFACPFELSGATGICMSVQTSAIQTVTADANLCDLRIIRIK